MLVAVLAGGFAFAMFASCLFVYLPGPSALWTCARAAWGLRGQVCYVALNRNAMQRCGDTMAGPCGSLKAAAIGALWCGEWPRGAAEVMPANRALAILEQDGCHNEPWPWKYYGLQTTAVTTSLRIVR